MKILILGAGKMGSFFTDLLSFEHEVAVLESDPKRMRFIYNALRLEAGRSCRIQTRISHQLRDTKLYDLGYRIGQDTPERILRNMWLPVCFYPPDVWSDIRQFGTTGERKYDHYLRRGSSGKNILQRYLFQPAPTYLRIYFRRTWQIRGLFARYSVCIHNGIRCHDETPGCSGYNFQTSHEDSQRPAFRRRLSIDGNPFQPAHTSSDRTHPRGTGYLAGNYQKQRFGKNERIPDQDQEEYRIIQFNTPLSKIQSGNNKSFHSCESSSSHLWNNLFNDFIP